MSDDGARTYTYNPRKPVATYGGRNMAIDPGPKDQRLAESHPDYGLVYRCDPLNTAMTIAGPVSVDLHVSSNCLDTDFIAKLIEEKEDGEATLLMDGVTRAMLRNGTDRVQHLKPGEIVKLTISLGHIYHTLEVASRLRVDVTSSNFPRRARNTNSGNLILAKDGDKDICVAQNTVHHGGGLPNVVNFCVLPT